MINPHPIRQFEYIITAKPVCFYVIFMSDQIEIFELTSPCKRVCETDRQGYCSTCFRSRDERFGWLTFSNAQKQEVLRLCRQRSLRKRYYHYQQHLLQSTSTQKIDDKEQLDLF